MQVELDRNSGDAGETEVTVTDLKAGTATVKVTTLKTDPSDTPVTKEVTITSAGGENPDPDPDPDVPDEYVETLIYYDNLGPANSDEPYLDSWSDNGKTASGNGASEIKYVGQGVKVTSYVKSSGYPEASGGRAIQFWTGKVLTIRNIVIPQQSGSTFKFTFGVTNGGSSVTTSSLNISLVNEKGVSKDIEYTLKQYGGWYFVEGLFNITGKIPEKMNVVIDVSATRMRIDDPKLVATTAPATQTIEFGASEGNVYPWAEMPKTKINGTYEYVKDGEKQGNYKYVTHHATTYSSKQYVRNYSACYDTRRHNPMWVAYPFHEIYEEGGWTRPATDPWRPDPEFEESEQSIIYPIDWQSHPSYTDQRRWSKLEGMTDYFGRGHMLMSANRGAGSKTVLLELNTQTFYPTNISPEYHKWPKHWELVEKRLTEWKCSDTVYVVTGCHYANDNNVIKDASWSGTAETYSKDCVVPTAHYKVFLRTKSGNTGKPIQECSADELMAIGFWFEQKLDSTPFTEQPALSSVTMSVSEIEKRTGYEFSFFPDVPESVKTNCYIYDWPGLGAISETTWSAEE